MQAADASLRDLNIYDPDPAIYTSVLGKVRKASLDCYIREVQSVDTLLEALLDAIPFQTSVITRSLYLLTHSLGPCASPAWVLVILYA